MTLSDTILANEMGNWFNQATLTSSNRKAKAIIVPHAGYRYSGQTAAYGYKALSSSNHDWEKVLILGPSHRARLTEPFQVSSFKSFDTPIGPLQSLLNSTHTKEFCFTFINKDVDLKEHSLELQLPFVKYSLPKAKVLPMIVGNLGIKHGHEYECQEHVLQISKLLSSEDTALVISSDFCHWGNNYGFSPELLEYDGPMSQRIQELDRKGMMAISSKSSANFSKYLSETGNTICGANPILLGMKALESSSLEGEWEWLNYSQSSWIEDYDPQSFSVSYAAAAFFIKD